MSAIERLLKRERAYVGVALALLVFLAWTYIWRGAGMGMSALQMTSLTLFPHARAEPMAGMPPPALTWISVIAMWWVMMIAMMTPSVAPLVLLYGRVLRHAAKMPLAQAFAPPMFLAAGYLSVWLAFSIVAAALQYALRRLDLISGMTLWSKSATLSACVLIAAGVYQLSPLKSVCVKHCRGPVEFLTRRWRAGRVGAFVMGAEHGVWCLGCCWVLMLLLFVVGVMNLVWIALLGLFVLAEKAAPRGLIVSRAGGAVLIAWGLATLWI
ncbi:MAG TPA: DUF2182 domain-containing protein [Steroidobacter sp.]|nr:DUF2182 domain-containing protein [Steroidobacter sp.]